MIRVIRKSLATAQDILFGRGLVSQTRNGNEYSLNRVSVTYAALTIAERDTVNPAEFDTVIVAGTSYSWVNGFWLQWDFWRDDLIYAQNDVRRYLGDNYVSLTDNNINNEPTTSAANWLLYDIQAALASIANNTSAIAVVSAVATANTADITDNTADIAAVEIVASDAAAAIALLGVSGGDSETSIIALAEASTTNTTNIATNTSAIAALESASSAGTALNAVGNYRLIQSDFATLANGVIVALGAVSATPFLAAQNTGSLPGVWRNLGPTTFTYEESFETGEAQEVTPALITTCLFVRES